MTDFEKIVDIFDRAKVKYDVGERVVETEDVSQAIFMKFGFSVLCFDFVTGELLTTYTI